MIFYLFLLLPIAALCGWYAGYKHKRATRESKLLPRDYFIGLKYLIDEQPDKAVDVFVKMLEVNSDTIETHLALGGLFRRRGEVNRAIRIHQNLIARPQLTKEQRTHALFELAKDYMRAGVLDRAENLFLELIELRGETSASFKSLLKIYEQQKDWKQAISIAKKLGGCRNRKMHKEIAHYYCELNKPEKALIVDKNCVRANIILGSSYFNKGNYKDAIRVYKKVADQAPEYISEIVQPLFNCYKQLENEEQCIQYLQSYLEKYPRISVILTLAEVMRESEDGDHAAIKFIIEQISHSPSLRGLGYLIKLYINSANDNAKKHFLLLQEMIQKLLTNKPSYRCEQCGFSSKTLYWYCPGCRNWSSIKPIQ